MTAVVEALGAASSSIRLKAALAAGTEPRPDSVGPLVARCAVEPDFYVRDMLTWALTRHSVDQTVPALMRQLESDIPQARSQALHTLSKIGDRRAWTTLTRALLVDPDDEVARSAWRVAVLYATADDAPEVADILVTQLGRGDLDMHRSLSRALMQLADAALPAVREAQNAADPMVRGHAVATRALMRDPESGFAFDVEAARRVAALGPGA